MDYTSTEVLELLRQEFLRRIATGAVIVSNATQDMLGEHRGDPEWIKANFSALVEGIQKRAYEIYLVSEHAAGGTALRNVFSRIVDSDNADAVLSALEENFVALDRFFLGLTQGRRPRAGSAFELVIKDLFTELSYPFTARPNIDGRPDFVLPSVDRYRVNPLDCVVFTVKRTLRERWRQIVTEGTRALGFYLATIDEKVSAGDLRDMVRSKIHLVVPKRIKLEVPLYSSAGNVIDFETFFEHHLDPAMRRWASGGTV
jgi:hypothetical protein